MSKPRNGPEQRRRPGSTAEPGAAGIQHQACPETRPDLGLSAPLFRAASSGPDAPRLKAAIYMRVSTDEQTPENQFDALTGWAAQLGLDVVNVYREQGSAWTAGHQPELHAAITDAKRGYFKVIIVWALDRVTREGPLRTLQYYHDLLSWGVRILSYQDTWTLYPNEALDLMLAVTGWVAGMESKRRSERTKAGLARARREGKQIGRPTGRKDTKKRRPRSDRGQQRRRTE